MANMAAAKLRAQLSDPEAIIVCPGVQDGLSARVCLQQGFQNLYMGRNLLNSLPLTN